MTIEVSAPKAPSCMGCPSNDAEVAFTFSSNEWQGFTVRLCRRCMRNLEKLLKTRRQR
jgi:hypothetical protein